MFSVNLKDGGGGGALSTIRDSPVAAPPTAHLPGSAGMHVAVPVTQTCGSHAPGSASLLPPTLEGVVPADCPSSPAYAPQGPDRPGNPGTYTSAWHGARVLDRHRTP